jgi:hypothetical protein
MSQIPDEDEPVEPASHVGTLDMLDTSDNQADT